MVRDTSYVEDKDGVTLIAEQHDIDRGYMVDLDMRRISLSTKAQVGYQFHYSAARPTRDPQTGEARE